ncbi:winged helix-turn-helix transcriptional regulator [Amycolatopsis lurida]
MKRTSFARWPCSIARTMDLFGDQWSPLVLRESFYGVRRFGDFQAELGIPRNTLADRLKRLTDEGLLEKRAYQDEPVRYDYLLTEMGRDFFDVLVVMSRWGDRWLSGPEGPPVRMHHLDCGHDTHAEVVCAACAKPLDPARVRMRTGPGYPEGLKDRPDIRRRFDDLAG